MDMSMDNSMIMNDKSCMNMSLRMSMNMDISPQSGTNGELKLLSLWVHKGL